LQIDYLGVSIDALLIIAPEEEAKEIAKTIGRAGVAVDEIGTVEEGEGALLHMDGKVSDFSPRFREAAYTPIKKAIGQDAKRDVAEMTAKVDRAARNAVEKKMQFIEKIKRR
jgi:hydrogenase expression/formation protein